MTALSAALIALGTFSSESRAETVGVVASIAPLHSLVARVMEGRGTPTLLLPPGASPHDNALRPSDAAALADAGLVIWMGPAIEPWLERPITALARNATVLRLNRTEGLTRLDLREGAAFEAEDKGDDDQEDGDEAHQDETDPHLWLDPRNAALWLDEIARALAKLDPDSADTYMANAEAGRTELAALEARIEARVAPLRGRPFIVLHDAFHYFEDRFDIEAAGALALSDARPPGPARVAQIRDRLRQGDIRCIFREPQGNAKLAERVARDAGVEIGVLDPLGAALAPGPALYPALIEGLADGLAACLNPL
ncbi:MAG: zinc ABC transporter substrate-binding protein [Paracoccaceae bacterium]|nr:zinc ABC transporter substrate-binding protein [Paracoccaceae bacterium]